MDSEIKKMFHEICGHDPSDDDISVCKNVLTKMPEKKDNLRDSIFINYLTAKINKIRIFPNKSSIPPLPDVKSKNLLITGMVRNISNNIHILKKLIDDLKKYFNIVKFYFYHNNSTDDSVRVLREWMKSDNTIYGMFAPKCPVYVLDNERKMGNRIPKFAEFRNKMIKEAINKFGNEFDYMLMTNTDFVEEIDATGIVRSLSFDQPWSIICGNCQFQKSFYHYDAYALRLLGESDEITKVYPDFYKYYGMSSQWLDKIYIFDEWTRVKSGFGDMCIINMPDLLELIEYTNGEICKVDWENNHICELISMCNNINGDVWVSPYITYPATSSIEGILYYEPSLFVPRDAGFFSVFNFLIGSIMTGTRVYPYYNKEIFLKLTKGVNKHFCYWTDNVENCWFEYFEPIQYYPGDDEHTTKKIHDYRITGGEFSGGEFREPKLYRKLVLNTVLFNLWRKAVNKIFNKFIKIKQPIIDSVNTFWKDNNLTDVIGVHYRHPSHFVENGHVLIRDYTKHIDKILSTNPNAKIFLATDTDFGIAAFRMKYQDKIVILPDIQRLELDNILEWAYAKCQKDAISDEMDFINNKGYQLHYSLINKQNNAGHDILKEALCLAKCKWIVHGISNISLAVCYMNCEIESYLV